MVNIPLANCGYSVRERHLVPRKRPKISWRGYASMTSIIALGKGVIYYEILRLSLNTVTETSRDLMISSLDSLDLTIDLSKCFLMSVFLSKLQC